MQGGIQAALWATSRNTEHRMEHWLQLIAVPNTPSSSGGSEPQSSKKRIADLEKARSRSHRGKAQKQASLGAGPTMLALPPPAPRRQGQKRATRGHRKDGKGKGKASSTPGGQKNFEYLIKLPVDFRKNFHEKFHKKKSATGFRARSAVSLPSNASSLTFVLVAVARSLTMSADVSNPRFAELHSQSTEKVADVPPTLPVSTFPPIVKPEACQKRARLLTSETALEAEVRDALRIRQQDGDSAFFLG